MGTSLYDLTIPVCPLAHQPLRHPRQGRGLGGGEGPRPCRPARHPPDRGHAAPALSGAACLRFRERPGGPHRRLENKVFPDEEKTFAELQDRIAGVIAFLRHVPRAAIEGQEEKAVKLDLPDGRSIPFTGQSFALNFAIPNFFFHVTTAYALLRHRGVPLGKLDYLGGI